MANHRVPREVRALYQPRHLDPQELGEWDRASTTTELRKALRLAEADLRYHSENDSDFGYHLAKADGLAAAVGIIDKLTKQKEMEKE